MNNNERLKNWLNDYTLIHKIVGEESKLPEVTNLKYDKKILDNPNNLEKITEKLKENGKKTLMIAPTSSGKTFTINEIFKKFKDDYLNILAVPTRSQAQQIAKSYGLACVVGDEKSFYSYDLSKTKNFVCVYDKLDDLSSISQVTKIRLIVDEAHNLVTAYNYRRKTIKNIIELENKILNFHGIVMHMTATYKVLSIFKYDNLISLSPNVEYKANTDEITIVKNSSNNNYNNFLYNYLKDKKAIVRLNSLETNSNIFENLKANGISVGLINSREKGYYEDEAGNVRYYNEVMDDIINNEQLSDKDIILSTSLIDCGTNLVNVLNHENYDYKAIYCIQDNNNSDIMNIEQFFNRLRFHNSEYVILIDNKEQSKKDFLSLNSIVDLLIKKINKNKEYFKMAVEALKFKYNENGIIDEKAVLAEIKSQAAYEYNNERNDLGCININDDLTISYDKLALYHKAYNTFVKQYYNHQDRLQSDLEDIFNIKINIEEVKDINDIMDEKLLEKNVKNILITLLDDENKINQINENKIVDSDIKKVKNTKTFTDVKNLINAGIETKEAIETVIKYNKNEINAIQNEAVKSTLKNLSQKEKGMLLMVIKDNSKIKDIKNESLKKIVCIINSDYYKLIKKSISIGNTISYTIDLIVYNTDKDACEAITNKQYIDNNNRYLDLPETLAGRIGLIQELILDFLLEGYNQIENKTKRIKLTDKVLLEISDKLNKEFTDKKEKFGKVKVKNLILKMFNARKVEYNGKIVYEINSLKLK